MELIERGDHYVELKEDGTFVRHHSKFIDQGGGLIRVDKDSVTKQETITRFTPRSLITADKVTGEIKQHQTGFVVEHELIGPGVHPDPLLKYVQAVLPDDFTVSKTVSDITVDATGKETTVGTVDVTRTAYKISKTTNKLVKISDVKLNEPIKRMKA